MAVKLLIAVANAKKKAKIDSLIEKLLPLFEDREYRFKINTEDFAAYGKEVLVAFETRAKDEGYQQIPSFEGIRLSFNTPDVQGWALTALPPRSRDAAQSGRQTPRRLRQNFYYRQRPY